MAVNRRAEGSTRTTAGPLQERPLPTLRPVRSTALDRTRGADLLAVPVAAQDGGLTPGPGARLALRSAGLDLDEVAGPARFRATAGSVLAFPVTRLADASAGAAASTHGAGNERSQFPGRLALVGTGDGSPQALRRAGAALARVAAGSAVLATTVASGLSAAAAQAFAEGLLLGAYTPPRTGQDDGPPPPVGAVDLLGVRHVAAVQTATEDARATWLSRDLAATPSSTKSPGWMATTARALADSVPGLEVEVLGPDELARQGFGGLVAVGGGSAEPPALVRVSWPGAAAAAATAAAGGEAAGVESAGGDGAGAGGAGAGAGAPPQGHHVVLVGKGITFDSGGLSIKPREAMVPMKTDMSGAGVVLATVLAAARRRLPHRVTAVLALAENAFGGSSYRPGDVVTVWGGTTVEVANTDAEGRMVLADALAWAVAALDPDVLVDVATLTGAASLGLGRRHAALYTSDDRLAAALAAAADASGERVWRMPLVEDYRPALDSPVADLRHVPAGNVFGGGGSITAALFLREFTAGRRWVHLDIAGPARADRDEHEVTKGATGYGARLLLRWLSSLR